MCCSMVTFTLYRSTGIAKQVIKVQATHHLRLYLSSLNGHQQNIKQMTLKRLAPLQHTVHQRLLNQTGTIMCIPRLFTSPVCKHIWLAIQTPCGPGMGFDNCPLFTRHGTILDWPDPARLPITECPVCGTRRGVYDMNMVRMVVGKQKGWKLGRDPHWWTGGLEVDDPRCIVM